MVSRNFGSIGKLRGLQPPRTTPEPIWISNFVAPCTSDDIKKAAERQGPRKYKDLKPFPYYYVPMARRRLQSTKRAEPKFSIEPWPTVVMHRNLLEKKYRPKFSFDTLCWFALRNSQTGKITINEVVAFVRHHFPFYRYVTYVKQSLATALRANPMFVKHKYRIESQIQYSLGVDVDPETMLTPGEKHYMNDDVRGRAFYTKMIAGSIGLPRQLFYQIIGHPAPNLAGPENSALFYHLLGQKQIPERSLFSANWISKESGMEPKFIEDAPCSYYGEGDPEAQMMSVEDAKKFIQNIGSYFALQNEEKKRGVANWATPNV